MTTTSMKSGHLHWVAGGFLFCNDQGALDNHRDDGALLTGQGRGCAQEGLLEVSSVPPPTPPPKPSRIFVDGQKKPTTLSNGSANLPGLTFRWAVETPDVGVLLRLAEIFWTINAFLTLDIGGASNNEYKRNEEMGNDRQNVGRYSKKVHMLMQLERRVSY